MITVDKFYAVDLSKFGLPFDSDVLVAHESADLPYFGKNYCRCIGMLESVSKDGTFGFLAELRHNKMKR